MRDLDLLERPQDGTQVGYERQAGCAGTAEQRYKVG